MKLGVKGGSCSSSVGEEGSKIISKVQIYRRGSNKVCLTSVSTLSFTFIVLGLLVLLFNLLITFWIWLTVFLTVIFWEYSHISLFSPEILYLVGWNQTRIGRVKGNIWNYLRLRRSEIGLHAFSHQLASLQKKIEDEILSILHTEN